MKFSAKGSALMLGLIGGLLSSGPALAGFTLSTAASLSEQVGASPYGLAVNGQGQIIGSTGNVTYYGKSYPATGFRFDPTTGNITPTGAPLSTSLPDGQGNYYTATTSGDLVRYNPASGTTQFLADLGTAGIASANTNLMFNGPGQIIGTSAYGGASGDGTIFSYNLTTQKLTVLASFNGADGAGVNGGLVSDGQGNLYGTTYNGGSANSGTVFRFNLATDSLTALTSFTGGNGSLPSAGLVSDGQGGLLGTTGVRRDLWRRDGLPRQRGDRVSHDDQRLRRHQWHATGRPPRRGRPGRLPGLDDHREHHRHLQRDHLRRQPDDRRVDDGGQLHRQLPVLRVDHGREWFRPDLDHRLRRPRELLRDHRGRRRQQSRDHLRADRHGDRARARIDPLDGPGPRPDGRLPVVAPARADRAAAADPGVSRDAGMQDLRRTVVGRRLVG